MVRPNWAIAFLVGVLTLCLGWAQSEVTTRDMNAVNWMEFKAWVPEKIPMVLLPVGTLEAHGVVNNGADNTVPEAMAHELAARLNAMVAPTIPYGVTTSLSAFAGGFQISEAVFKAYSREVIAGLAQAGFLYLVVLNGHGPNFEPLQEACAEVSEATGLKTLVFNWWAVTVDITREVFGSEGGHAGINEQAAVLATNPEYVHPEYYSPELAWWREDGVALYPFPSSIILYRQGEGFPNFDAQQAELFYSKVLDRLEGLVQTSVVKWKKM